MEVSKTLDMPEKKRYKRPASGGVRHTRRSASAEVIDREDEEMMGDNENLSPARRRPRRKKTHGLLFFIFFQHCFMFLSVGTIGAGDVSTQQYMWLFYMHAWTD